MNPFVLILSTSAETLAMHVQKALLGDDQDRFIIDCKYYTAEVGVKAILSSEGEQETISVAEAIVVCFEFTQLDSWEAACHWQKKASDYGTPIRLLVCSQLPEDEEARSTVYKHALQNHFEVIELNPSAVDADAEEEFGLPRLRAALEAHQWPGLRLKAQNAVHSPAVESQHLKEPSLDSNGSKKLTSENQKSDRRQGSQEDFENLFSQLLELKSKAANMDVVGRRKLAEKVTLKFWRALDGDEDEVEGLSDEST
uniref:Alpha-and gamma-adaptin-binding protein p34 n=1 Tax=Schistocephalus solidus TaxID=70667 RepID=A0A0X3P1B5_SCHSO